MSDIRQPDQLKDDIDDDEAPSTSHSSKQMRGRAFRKVVPLEEEEASENNSVNVPDIFTKATTSHTDPATGDIIPVSHEFL